jgi:hypothetical protein
MTAAEPRRSLYTVDVAARVRESADQAVECVITQGPVPGVSAPAVVVADRWGEIVFAAETDGWLRQDVARSGRWATTRA